LPGHCFALFGAEETGLDGSKFLVSQLSEEEILRLISYIKSLADAEAAEPGEAR